MTKEQIKRLEELIDNDVKASIISMSEAIELKEALDSQQTYPVKSEVDKEEIKRIIGDAFVNNIKGQEMYGAYGGEIAEVYGYDEFEKEIIEKIAPYLTPSRWLDSTVIPDEKGLYKKYPTYINNDWELIWYNYKLNKWYYSNYDGVEVTEPFKYLVER